MITEQHLVNGEQRLCIARFSAELKKPISQVPDEDPEVFERLKALMGPHVDGFRYIKSLWNDDNVIVNTKQWVKYYPFLVHSHNGYEVWAVRPHQMERHHVIGTYLGYPRCCVFEHLSDCGRTVKSKNQDRPIQLKKEILRLRRGYRQPDRDAYGIMPCAACLKNPPENIDARINEHRLHPKKRNAALGIMGWLDACILHFEDKLKDVAWTVHDPRQYSKDIEDLKSILTEELKEKAGYPPERDYENTWITS